MRTGSPVLAVLALAACGGGSSEPDAPPAIDAVPDAGGASPNLVGSWRRLPDQVNPDVPVEMRDVLTLGADGSYALVEDGGATTNTATYTADATALTVTGTTPEGTATLTLGYVATADRLMLGALFPVGAVDGTVGTWHGDADNNGTAITIDLELRADHTAHEEHRVGTDPPDVFDGTWAYDVDDVVFTTMIDTTTVNQHFAELRGVVIGNPFFERIPAAKPGAAGRGGGPSAPLVPGWIGGTGVR